MATPIKYKPEYAEKLYNHLAQGFSLESFTCDIHVSRSTMYRWFDEYPEFMEAKQKGLEACQKWFEQRLLAKVSGASKALAKQGIKAKDIDTACLIFALKTRFHKTYSEKQHVTQETQVTLNYNLDDSTNNTK